MRYLIIAFSLLLFSCTSEKYEDKLLVCVVPSDSKVSFFPELKGFSNAMKVTLRKDNSGKGEHILKLDLSPYRQVYPDIDFDKYIEMDDAAFGREEMMMFKKGDIDAWPSINIPFFEHHHFFSAKCCIIHFNILVKINIRIHLSVW